MPNSIEDIVRNPRIATSATHGGPLAHRTPEDRAAGRIRTKRVLAKQEARMEIQRQRIARLHQPTFHEAANDNAFIARQAAA